LKKLLFIEVVLILT